MLSGGEGGTKPKEEIGKRQKEKKAKGKVGGRIGERRGSAVIEKRVRGKRRFFVLRAKSF